jgi:hypothetical protein
MSRTVRPAIQTHVIRPRQAEPPDREWLNRTMAERIEAVWELTKISLAWNQDTSTEPRLQKSMTRILRRPVR